MSALTVARVKMEKLPYALEWFACPDDAPTVPDGLYLCVETTSGGTPLRFHLYEYTLINEPGVFDGEEDVDVEYWVDETRCLIPYPGDIEFFTHIKRS